MEDIYYLVHVTNTLPSKFKELRISPTCKDASGSQFPGVFFTLVTKYNFNTERYYPGKYIMIFSKELLKQKNYHFNIIDCNGMITEYQTYFPWNLEKAVKSIKNEINEKTKANQLFSTVNEVVFHDSISMKYCCKIIEPPSLEQNENKYFNYITKGGVSSILPRKSLKTSEPANLKLLPFYCFNMEDNYSGTSKIHKSSLRWFKMMLKVAGIEKQYKTKQECIDALRKKAVYLCTHREMQNISILKSYT